MAKPDSDRPENDAILIAEDSPTQAEQLRHMLTHRYKRVTVTPNGKAALLAARGHKPALIISDVVMPEMNGYDLCRAIKSDADLREVPVVLVTTLSDPKDVIEGLACGADNFIRKPYSEEYLLLRIDQILANRELRKSEKTQTGMEIVLGGRRHFINAERRQILDLLISTFEEAVRLNDELRERERALATANHELKETQVQLVQSAKMASLGQLVAGVAHEINNPLAFVMNHQGTVARALDNIAEEVGSRLSAAGARSLQKARERSADMQMGLERIKDLVLKLRTFSRLDEGELKFVKIEESIEAVITLLQHRLQDRIRLTRKYGAIKVVACYPGPLNQVIMNVMSNAIDAIEGNGEITIATGKDDSMLFIAVTDTGKGIPAAIRERIFEPFYTTKPVGQGTGLGLSISYGIIQRHKGVLAVQSEEGKGTTVVIKIPLNPGGTKDHG